MITNIKNSIIGVLVIALMMSLCWIYYLKTHPVVKVVTETVIKYVEKEVPDVYIEEPKQEERDYDKVNETEEAEQIGDLVFEEVALPYDVQTNEFSIGTVTDLDMLAMIIYQEAGSDLCQDSTRQMVGEVVLNRVADNRFPNTVDEVLTAEGQYGALCWTGIVWPRRAYTQQEAHAVQRAYVCAYGLLSNNVERLLPQDTVWQAGFAQGVETMAIQDGMYFCK